MDDATPPTEPQGALVPPNKPPSTAVATATPAPEPNRHARHPNSFRDPNPLRRVVRQTLDAVDTLADTIANGLGLRPR
jgi:hypothetical protein